MSSSGVMDADGAALNILERGYSNRQRSAAWSMRTVLFEMMGVREMATDNAHPPGLQLPWAGKSVRPEQVEEELTRLWHLAADNMRTGLNIHVRTNVLNFVICALSIDSALRAITQIRELSSTHIGRVILLILDANGAAPSSASTWVTLRSFPIASDLMRHHFEQITVITTGAASYSAANIIQPLLKPDLPVYLWWADDLPGDDALFNHLVSMSSRVIVDSSRFLTPEKSCVTLSSLLDASPACAFSDLNWGRITPWRELVAQFFDTLEYRPYLAGIHHVEIEHAAAPLAAPARTRQGEVSPNPIRALLLAAWLENRLDWRITSDKLMDEHDAAIGAHAWNMIRSTGPLLLRTGAGRATGKLGESGIGRISIRPRVHTHMPPGSICLVRIFSNIDDSQATFTINCEDDHDYVLTSVEQEESSRPQRTVYLEPADKESDLLHEELEIMGHDYLYEETLHTIFALLTP
ncbi:MAG TPA: glucose-6-phosphate dehydrogenase assembly protein OpcA [Ktedonobacteraceae bacterium]|nr:glucose-6-phosphate dehydrogenase assembly protein OpcA [Ktedonobacteraceae bacterium]